MLLVGLGSGARKITGSGTVAGTTLLVVHVHVHEDQLRPGILEPHAAMPRLRLYCP